MSAGSDVVLSDDMRVITYRDMYGNPQSIERTHECQPDVRDVLQMYAAAFRYAIDRNDGGEARRIFNENTQSYLKQSFDDYDALVKAGVTPEVLEKVADNMASLISRKQPHTAEAGNTTAEAILRDISEELKQPPKWEVEQKDEDIYCR